MIKTFLARFSMILIVLCPIKAYGDVSFVDGNSELLRLLTHTERLSGNPVLIFNDAGGDAKKLISLPGPNALGYFIFKDSGPGDIALELTADHEIYFPGLKNPVKIRVPEKKDYYVYLDTDSLNFPEVLQRLKVTINGRSSSCIIDANNTDRFAGLIKISLDKGINTISFSTDGPDITTNEISFPLKILLLSNEALQNTEILKKSILTKLDQGISTAGYIFEKNKGDFYISSPLVSRDYSTKIKLKQKIFKIPVSFYSQTRPKISPWVSGPLPGDRTWPLIISRNKNYGFDKKVAHYLALNLNNKPVKGELSLKLTTPNIKQKLSQILLNGAPLSDANSVMYFAQGFNQIDIFFNDSVDRNDACIVIQDILITAQSKSDVSAGPDTFVKAECFSKENTAECVFLNGQPAILSKTIDIDITEYPLINSTALVTNGREYNPRFILLFYTGDGREETEVLEIPNSASIDLLQMIHTKWPDKIMQKRLRLNKILVIIDPKKQGYDHDTLKNTLIVQNQPFFYKDEALIVAAKDISLENITREKNNIDANFSVQDRQMNVFYNSTAAIGQAFDIQSGSQSGEIRLTIPIDTAAINQFPYFSFDYSFDKDRSADFKFFVSVQNSDKTFTIPIENFNDYGSRIEIDLRTVLKSNNNARGIVIALDPMEDETQVQPPAPERPACSFSNFIQYQKFPHPLISKDNLAHYLELLKLNNPDILKIDDKDFKLLDFWNQSDSSIFDTPVFSVQTTLKPGRHHYEYCENRSFNNQWVILDPLAPEKQTKAFLTDITFTKINPAKYILRIRKADKPFWLVFNENYHSSWGLFHPDPADLSGSLNETIAIQYPHLGIEEQIRKDQFLIRDISFMKKKPIPFLHMKVNGYANGWYIDPAQALKSDDFTLVLYFRPQTYFYLGALVAAFTFFVSLILVLIFRWQ